MNDILLGKSFIEVSTYQRCKVAAHNPPKDDVPGKVLLVVQDGGHRWVTYDQLENDYTEAF